MYNEASAGKRVLAYFLDGLICYAITYIFIVILIFAFVGKEFTEFFDLLNELNQYNDPNAINEDIIKLIITFYVKLFIIGVGVQLLAYFAYYVIIPYYSDGASIGKKICGIKIIQEGKDRVSFGMLVVREFLMKCIVNALSCGIINIISFIKILASDDRRAIHDLASQTRVVDKN